MIFLLSLLLYRYIKILDNRLVQDKCSGMILDHVERHAFSFCA